MESYFVDPAAGNDTTGDGTIGLPWKTVQHALDTISAGLNDIINIKSGAADVLTAALSLATYGTGGQLVFQGYDAAEGDGGIGEIDGNGLYSIVSVSQNNRCFIDMKLGNCGANQIISLNQNTQIAGCELHGSSVTNAVALGIRSVINNCHIHNVGSGNSTTAAGNAVSGAHILNCFFEQTGANRFLNCIGNSTRLVGNIVVLNQATGALVVSESSDIICSNNTILNTTGAGTSRAMFLQYLGVTAQNNIVVGFGGVGGTGIQFQGGGFSSAIASHNAFYNVTTPIGAHASNVVLPNDDNEILAEDPFLRSGALTFANRFTYFAPKDVGNLQGGAWPLGCRRDKGAVQHAALTPAEIAAAIWSDVTSPDRSLTG